MTSILLVDDEAAICIELQRNLRELGYQVEVAHTFESALGSICESRFDLIILEFNLSSENGTHPRTGGGVRLISGLRKSGIGVPILMYTVMEGADYERASLLAGADGFMPKSTSVMEFVSAFRALLTLPDYCIS